MSSLLLTRGGSLVLLMLAGGCARAWQTTTWPQPATPTKHEKLDVNVQVFSHGNMLDNMLEWKKAWASRDSISGIPVDSSAKCRSCRQTLARTDVDSIRIFD